MNRNEIKKKLPIGGMSQIAKISGINLASIQRFFKGETTKLDIEIIKATTKYLKEYNEEKEKAIQELKEVASA